MTREEAKTIENLVGQKKDAESKKDRKEASARLDAVLQALEGEGVS